MNHDTEFDPALAALFTTAPAPVAPGRVLTTALERIEVTPQDRRVRVRLGIGTGIAPRWRVLIVAAALVAALLAALAVGAALRQPTPPPTPGPFSLVIVKQDQLKSGPMVSVELVRAHGGIETLALIDSDRNLGGAWTGEPIQLSGDGRLAIPTAVGAADSQMAIVDLHDLTAPALHPDVLGANGYWMSDGRFAVDLGDETVAAYDPSTGRTTTVARDTAVRATDAGMGPRRFRSDGSTIKEPLDLEERMPGDRMTDYAAALDGGTWALFTRRDDDSQVQLVYSSADGKDRFVATFAAPPLQTSAVIRNAVFVAMAPDDRQLAVATSADGAPGPVVVVDTATGSVSDPIDGAIGWIDADSLKTPRDGERPALAAPDEVRGEWARVVDADGLVNGEAARLQVGYTQAVADPGPHSSTLAVAADGPDRLQFGRADGAGPACGDGLVGTYAWIIEGDILSLAPLSEPCPTRRGLLTGRFERNLPYRGNWEPRVAAGTRFLVPELAVRLRIPEADDATVWDHSDSAVSLADQSGSANLWSLTRLDERALIPPECGSARILGGLDGVLAYLDTIAADGAVLADRVATNVQGLPAIRGTLRTPSGDTAICGRWPMHAGGWQVQDGENITIFETPNGHVYSLLVRGDQAWADALTSSLEFVADSGS